MLLGGVLIIKLHRITLERRTLVRKAGLPEGEDAEVETSVGDRRTWCREIQENTRAGDSLRRSALQELLKTGRDTPVQVAS